MKWIVVLDVQSIFRIAVCNLTKYSIKLTANSLPYFLDIKCITQEIKSICLFNHPECNFKSARLELLEITSLQPFVTQHLYDHHSCTSCVSHRQQLQVGQQVVQGQGRGSWFFSLWALPAPKQGVSAPLLQKSVLGRREV